MSKTNKPPEPRKISIKERPIPKPFGVEDEWSFSFKYYNQIENFGLKTNGLKKTWFASILERFRELNRMKESEVNLRENKKGLRYHEINWDAKNIPISRNDLTWIDPSILENEEEIPFMQFHVSKAMGRIIGFWYDNIFYVVLLDPMHNLQPSKYNNYKVIPCNPLSCEISDLLRKIEIIRHKADKNSKFDVLSELSKLVKDTLPTNAILFFLEDDYLDEFNSIIGEKTISELIELGLASD